MPKLISNYEYNQTQVEMSQLKQDVKELERKLESATQETELAVVTLKENRTKMDSMQENFELKEKKAVVALEDKLAKEITALEAKHNKEITALERKLTSEKQTDLEKMTKNHYKKLSDSMTKLHEEGNAQTKFMQETVQNVIKSASGFATANDTSTQIEHKTEAKGK